MQHGMQSFAERVWAEAQRSGARVELRLLHKVDACRVADGALVVESTSKDGARHAIACQHVVVAVPPRLAARAIRFEPALPRAVADAMSAQNTWMGATAKIAFHFDACWWRRRSVNSARFSRASSIFQIMDASAPPTAGDDAHSGVHALVAFAQPPPVDAMRAPFFTLDGAAAIDALDTNDALEPEVRAWLAAAVRDVLALPAAPDAPAPRLTRLAYHSWRHDALCFCTDGRLPPGHAAYYQHPHDGGDLLRAPIPLTGAPHSPSIVLAASETDDESPGMLDGAVRAGTRAARVVLAALQHT